MIRVGTCSFAEKSLIRSGEFYPPEVKASEARLRYYASHFNTVEVHSACYTVSVHTTLLWDLRTPSSLSRTISFEIKCLTIKPREIGRIDRFEYADC
jgi:uncharacterized protein YecE (DUF72 family)